MEADGDSNNNNIQLDVTDSYWAGDITREEDTLSPPSALPSEYEGARVIKTALLISVTSLALFNLF